MKRFTTVLTILCSLVSSIASSQGDTVYFDPPDFVFEDVKTPLPNPAVAKFIFIAFPDTLEQTYASIDTLAVPQEFSLFFDNQSRGEYHVDCSTILDPRNPGRQWIGSHTLGEYRNGTVTDYAAYRSSYIGEVTAETIFNIYHVYVDSLGRENPFADCDYIFVVHKAELGNGQWAGIASTYLTSAIPDSILPSRSGFTTFKWERDGSAFIPETLKTIYQHEFGHDIGASHFPDDPSMTYGIYAPMRPVLSFGNGFVPFHHRNLVQMGWAKNDTVSSQQTDIELYDLQSSAGQPLQVNLDAFGSQLQGEAFYLSLHRGLGYASQYPTRGVAVWHHASGTGMWDLEQARGRYDDPELQTGPDPVAGIDLMDSRWEDPPYWWDFWYDGHPSDFFPVAEDSITEFSYRTNPSTYGGATRQRTADQNVATTLTILMTASSDTSVTVDVLRAPRELILSPSEAVYVAQDSALTVVWDDYFNADGSEWDIMDQVQLLFSTNGGVSYEPVASADYDVFTLSWTPSEHYATANGRFRLEFTNTLSDAIGEIEFGYNVEVEGTQVPWESVLAPNGAEELVVGVPVDVTWSNFWDNDITRVDLLFSTNGGGTWSSVADSISYQTVDDINIHSWTPGGTAVSDSMRIKLRFHSAAGQAEDTSDGDIFVFPVRSRYLDVTQSGLHEDRPYEGYPSSIVPIAVANDTSGVDVLVGIGSGTSSAKGKLFVNYSYQDGSLDFQDETDILLPDGLLELGFGALAVGDYDGDGEDFFACRPDGETSQLFSYDDNNTEFVSTNAVAFAGVDTTLLQFANCASWIDYDHDGDLDLYVGRAEGTTAEPDALFRYSDSSGDFTEVAEAVGLAGRSDIATSCVAWCDIDSDGLWEVARGSNGPGGTVQLLTQVAADSFAVVVDGIPGEVSGGEVQAIHWADFDRDSDFDLLIIRCAGDSYVCENVDGVLTDVTILPTANDSALEGMPFDYDLDGWTDIIVPNGAAQSRPLLLVNFRGLGDAYPDFKDMAQYTGLSIAATNRSVLAADFNRDGDQDLFVGRQNSGTGTLYRSTQPDSTETPAAHWLGFKLIPGTEDNASAIGTTVSLCTASGGTPLGVQIVDGGSGRGGQMPRRPIFGLGDLDEAVLVTVRWPAGRVMEFRVEPEEFDDYVEVVQTSSLTVDDTSVAFAWYVYPGDLVDWSFTWETEYWSDLSLDQVQIELATGTTCANLGDGYLKDSDGSVSCTVTYQVDAVTKQVSFKHEVRWVSEECYPGCTYRYRVLSDNGSNSDESPTSPNWKTAKFKICPSSN